MLAPPPFVSWLTWFQPVQLGLGDNAGHEAMLNGQRVFQILMLAIVRTVKPEPVFGCIRQRMKQ
jgi:hypothetical protein